MTEGLLSDHNAKAFSFPFVLLLGPAYPKSGKEQLQGAGSRNLRPPSWSGKNHATQR